MENETQTLEVHYSNILPRSCHRWRLGLGSESTWMKPCILSTALFGSVATSRRIHSPGSDCSTSQWNTLHRQGESSLLDLHSLRQHAHLVPVDPEDVSVSLLLFTSLSSPVTRGPDVIPSLFIEKINLTPITTLNFCYLFTSREQKLRRFFPFTVSSCSI